MFKQWVQLLQVEQWGHFFLEVLAITTLATVLSNLVVSNWKSNPGYALASILGGVLTGWISLRLGVPEGMSILLAVLGTLTTPATIVKIQGKSLLEVIDEVRSKKV